jgi:hypothetical protein
MVILFHQMRLTSYDLLQYNSIYEEKHETRIIKGGKWIRDFFYMVHFAQLTFLNSPRFAPTRMSCITLSVQPP